MSRELDAARALVKMLEEKEQEGKVRLSELKAGDVVKTPFGDLIVLGHLEHGTKVISKGFVKKNVRFGKNSPDINKSEIKNLLSGEVLEMFEKEFGAENIVEETTALTTVDMQKDYGTYTGKIRLLTFDEAREFNELLVNEELPGWYWTMTPWSTKERGWHYSVAVVSPSGGINFSDYGSSLGVRPFCILKSDIFVSKGKIDNEKHEIF